MSKHVAAARDQARGYPIAQQIPEEVLDREIRTLERLRHENVHRRAMGYLKLGGPAFIGAGLTLGAGTFTASMLSGAQFGYRTMWLIWFAMGLGLFMIAAMARFTCRGGFRVIALQNRYHGRFVGSFLTAVIGTAFVAIIFNYGQYSLGTHLIESLTPMLGFEFPRRYNWIVYMAVTSWLVLSYGRRRGRGTRLVETAMKVSIAIILITFLSCLLLVEIDWAAMMKGIFVPWLPSGVRGLDLFIASSAAAVGVMDWIIFHYAGLARGWREQHEPLARFDMIGGLFVPFVLINFVVIAVFAGTLHPQGLQPETAPELSRALAPLLGETWSQVVFYLGFLAVPITTTVGMSLAGAIALHEAFGWEPDTSSWRWKTTALLPQIGFVAVWYPQPVLLVIIIGAFLSLTNNIVGWSMYLLLNDRRVLGENRSKSYLWNLGILLQIVFLNALGLIYVFNRLDLWIR